MRDPQVPVSLKWAERITFKALRGITLGSILHDILEELPPDRALYWRGQLLGVDTTTRRMYYGRQSTQASQPNNSAASPDPKTSRCSQGSPTSSATEGLMGDDEE